MDFGATVCSARAPQCSTCAMKTNCRSFPFTPERRRRAR
jgi:adenine-specific DNA glycosylase